MLRRTSADSDEVSRGSDMMSPGLWPRWRIICGIRLRDGAQAGSNQITPPRSIVRKQKPRL